MQTWLKGGSAGFYVTCCLGGRRPAILDPTERRAILTGVMASTRPTGPRVWRRAKQLARRGLSLVAGALLLASCAIVGSSPATPGGASAASAHPSTSASVTSTAGSRRSSDPTGSAPSAWSPPPGASPFAFYDPAPVPPGSAHGTLLRYQPVGPVPGAGAGATLWRILYLTRTATGSSVVGSGYVAVPGRAAPAGGYPVIAWAHGTTGMARACAPSLFATSLPGGLHHLVLAPYLAALVDQGYLVTAADYPGLGTPGALGYYAGLGEGYAVLDAIRASQGLESWHASGPVVILGHSQGGHAALFAGQLAAGYTSEQRIVGVVAAAPVTSMTGIAAAAAATSQPVNADVLLTLVSWSRTYPGVPLEQLLTPSAVAGIGQLNAMCDTAVTDAYHHTPSAAVFAPGAATNPALVGLGRANSPGDMPTGAPILIVQGSADDEVSVSRTASFVAHVCAVQPDRLTYRVLDGATHEGVLTAARSEILGWIGARFAGQPAPTGCG